MTEPVFWLARRPSSWRPRMSWLVNYLWPRAALSDLQVDVGVLLGHQRRQSAQLERMEHVMAADRDLLASIAEGLTALATPVSDLIASEAALRARVADLEGEAAADEAGDLEAAGAVKTAFDGIADKFRSEPEVPDVEPLPEPTPADGSPSGDDAAAVTDPADGVAPLPATDPTDPDNTPAA